MSYRIEILAHEDDGRAKIIEGALSALDKPASVRVVDVYTSDNAAIMDPVLIGSVTNPVTQSSFIRHPCESGNDTIDLKFDWALEIGFLPGVTDNIGHTVEELLELSSSCFPRENGSLKPQEDPRFRGESNKVYSSRLYLITGDLERSDIELLAAQLSNSLIQRASIKTRDEFEADGGMDVIVPNVTLEHEGTTAADDVDLNISDEALIEIGDKGIANADGSRRGPLGMSLLYMKAVQEYFAKTEGRAPKDIELETIAQTWSEHCKHTIFASSIDEIKDGIYKHYIKRATQDIRAARQARLLSPCKRGPVSSPAEDPRLHGESKGGESKNGWNDEIDGDFCLSVFSDNAGGIVFDEDWLITDKVETHNSPSALDPFGGSITGIVGVNRDCMGFGMGAKPVINRYGYCLAPVPASRGQLLFQGKDSENNQHSDIEKVTVPRFEYYRDKNLTTPILSPETIMNGVVAGVEAGGNQSGIPTPQGFAYFDDRYVGKPLVFVGTIGLMPRMINDKLSHEKCANPGDKIMMIGGRVGRDGIHGATFSSVALDEGSPATAVQIGDPITQKKFSDAIIKELRGKSDSNGDSWYSAITDNGAGGLSSSVGEMAEQSGGFHLELEKVPLKYPGMAPWEIWISESQERMTLSVPPKNTDKIIELMARRGVEATVIGTYTDTGRSHITYNGQTIMDMEMDFLHDGLPETPLKTVPIKGGEPEPDILCVPRESGDLSALKKGPRFRGEDSFLDTMLLQMLSRLNICSKEFIATQYDHNVQGSAVLGPIQGPGRLYGETSISRPLLTSPKGVVLSQGLAPRYGDIDCYHMAASALDMAVRNAVAAGVDYNHLALLDNFCWCSSDEPERLYQLKRAAEAIYELAVLYKAPFISGKDSMFNDFKGFDADGQPVKISAPPTLLISSIGVIPNVEQSISPAPKAAGDFIYLLGETRDELGGSEYYDHHGHLGQNVPQVDGEKNAQLYALYSKIARERYIASAIGVGFGGLGVALAKKAIAGQMGMEIDLECLNSDLRADKLLFSESNGRILVTVAPAHKEPFEQSLESFGSYYRIGTVTEEDKLIINNTLDVKLKALEEAYKAPLRDY